MYFKISLLVCSMYFFTATRSVGLSADDISSIDKLVKNYRKQNGDNHRITIKKYMKTDKVYNWKFHNNVEEYDYQFGLVAKIDDKSLPDLLIYLANLEKITDEWTGKTMTTFEVKIFMTTFKEKDKKDIQDGLLTYAELANLIDVDFNLESDFKNEIKKEFDDGDSINALMFLVTILKYKPEGRGLDRRQIKKCSALYTTYYGHLPKKRLRNLLHSLQIVSDDYFRLIRFDQIQPAALELQELLLFWSEYNKDVEKDSPHFSSTDVRYQIIEFCLYDFNNNGVISYLEFIPIARNYLTKNDTEAFSEKSKVQELDSITKLDRLAKKLGNKKTTTDNPDENYSLTTATYLYMKYYLIYGRNKNLSDDEPPNELNDSDKPIDLNESKDSNESKVSKDSNESSESNDSNDIATENVALDDEEETNDLATENLAMGVLDDEEETNENQAIEETTIRVNDGRSIEETNDRRNHRRGFRRFVHCFGG